MNNELIPRNNTVLDSFRKDFNSLLSTECPSHAHKNSNRTTKNCTSFTHFQQRWRSISFSTIHLGHSMSKSTALKYTPVLAQRRGRDQNGRRLLQNMFQVVLSHVQTRYTESSLSSSSSPFILVAYTLYCLHGTQLYTPTVSIRVDPETMNLLMALEQRAVLKQSSNSATGVIAELIRRKAFCVAVYTGEYLSEGAAREWSTVVDISIPLPSFKLVPFSLSRSPLSKTPKQVFFNPIKYI